MKKPKKGRGPMTLKDVDHIIRGAFTEKKAPISRKQLEEGIRARDTAIEGLRGALKDRDEDLVRIRRDRDLQEDSMALLEVWDDLFRIFNPEAAELVRRFARIYARREESNRLRGLPHDGQAMEGAPLTAAEKFAVQSPGNAPREE